MATIIELGQKVKEKYKGSYDDMSDEEVGRLVKLKYSGAYDDFTEVEYDTPAPAEVKKQGIVEGLAVGSLKGIGSSLAGAEKLGGKILDAPLRLFGAKPLVEKGLLQEEQEKGTFEAKTTAEKVGKGAEQIAEFFLPIPGGAKARFAGQVLEKAPALARFGKAAIGVGKDAVDVATRSAIQKGSTEDVGKDIALAGAFGAVGKGASGALSRLKTPVAQKLIDSLIKPLQKDLAYGKNPSKGILDEGIVANSLEDLSQKVFQRRQEIGSQISAAVKASNKRIDLTDALTPINQAIINAQKVPRTNAAIIQRLQDTRADLMGAIGAGTNLLSATKALNAVSAEKAFEFKKLVGDITRFTGNPTDDKVVNAALKRTYGLVKEKMNKAVNGLDNLNERYANLTSAEIAAKYRGQIEQRQSLVSLKGNLTGGSALIAFVASGGSTIPAVLAGLAGSQLDKIVGSAAVFTRLAKWIGSASQKEKQAVFSKLPALRDSIQRVMGETSQ